MLERCARRGSPSRPAGWVDHASRARCSRSSDVETDPVGAARSCARAPEQRGWRSSIQVPMLRGDDVVGVIGVTRVEPGPFARRGDRAPPDLRRPGRHRRRECAAARPSCRRARRELTALRRPAHGAGRGGAGRQLHARSGDGPDDHRLPRREISGLDGGVVFEYDESAEEFVHRASTDAGSGARRGQARRARIRKGEGVLGRTAVTLEPVQVADITWRAPTRAGCART